MRNLVLVLLVGCTGNALTGGSDLALAPGRCAEQHDCPDGTICQPTPPGAPTGTCVTPSTRHCAACSSDSDCGADGLCFQGPGDLITACHVDCSLSWLACPDGYNCAPILYQNETRHVCLPIENRCNDAGGSACKPGDTQPCTRTNSAGSCDGVRPCVNGQLGACAAPEPAFLDACSDAPPSGCTELPSLQAISTPNDCGACGNACPPNGSNTADPACIDPMTKSCGISCRGDRWDVDGDAANGCEVAEPDTGNHDQTTASPFPATDCSDSSSQNSFSGHILSDNRPHLNPPVAGFDAKVGSAPHWYSVFSSGGVCADDYSLTLTTTGGPNVPCYVATFISDKTNASVTVTGNGSATTNGPAGAYSDDTTIYFKIEKICSTMSVGGADVRYTVSYHL